VNNIKKSFYLFLINIKKFIIKTIAVLYKLLYLNEIKKSPQRKFLENYLLPKLDIKGKVLFIGVREYCHYEHYLTEGQWITLDIDDKVDPNIVGDVCNMDLPDDSFDWVIFNGVFEYLENPLLAISEIWRVIRPGGYLLFGAPYTTLDSDGGLWRVTPAGVKVYLNNFKIIETFNIKNKHIYALCKRACFKVS